MLTLEKIKTLFLVFYDWPFNECYLYQIIKRLENFQLEYDMEQFALNNNNLILYRK